MKPVRMGIVGCGYWGPNLIRNFVEMDDAHVVAVSDLNQDRLEYIQTRYSDLEITRDYHDIFEMDLDAAVVATPPDTHHQIAQDCLRAGLASLVEKPLTLNSHDARDLVQLADQQGLVLMVGHTFQYNAAVMKLKELVSSGELGNVFYMNSVRVNLGLFQHHLDVIWDLAPHDISIFQYVLDQRPDKVSAQGADCVFPGKYDLAYLNLVFPNGELAHLHISWLDPYKVRRITVVGDQKMAVFDDVESFEKIRIFDKGVDIPAYTNTLEEFHLSYRNGDVLIPRVEMHEPLRMECQHFVDCINKGEIPTSSGISGLEVVAVLEAASRSMKNGGQYETIAWEESDIYVKAVD